MLWQIVGFFSYFEISQFKIRKEIKKVIKHSVPSNQLKVLCFSKLEQQKIVWINSHEFRYNGRLYDVIHKKSLSGGVIFRCLDDRQETKLFEKLNQTTSFNLVNRSDKNPLNHWMRFSQTLFLLENTDNTAFASFRAEEEHIFNYQHLHTDWCKLPQAPPPRV